MFGFPKETEEEFEETLRLLEEIKLYKIHVFQYSKRDGTKAALEKEQVTSNIKEARSKKVIELSKKQHEEIAKACIGKVLKVLVEEKEEIYKGHTANYMYVGIEGAQEDLRNKIVDVKITDVQGEMLIGILN